MPKKSNLSCGGTLLQPRNPPGPTTRRPKQSLAIARLSFVFRTDALRWLGPLSSSPPCGPCWPPIAFFSAVHDSARCCTAVRTPALSWCPQSRDVATLAAPSLLLAWLAATRRACYPAHNRTRRVPRGVAVWVAMWRQLPPVILRSELDTCFSVAGAPTALARDLSTGTACLHHLLRVAHQCRCRQRRACVQCAQRHRALQAAETDRLRCCAGFRLPVTWRHGTPVMCIPHCTVQVMTAVWPACNPRHA